MNDWTLGTSLIFQFIIDVLFLYLFYLTKSMIKANHGKDLFRTLKEVDY